jgi:hypothetical protein
MTGILRRSAVQGWKIDQQDAVAGARRAPQLVVEAVPRAAGEDRVRRVEPASGEEVSSSPEPLEVPD